MRISVVIPTHQRIHLVLDAIASAFDQHRPAHEVIVVDDGSTDGSSEAISRAFGSRVRLVGQQHLGLSAARNAGVAIAAGELVAFLDDDDRWLPHHLATVAQLASRHPRAVLLSTCHDAWFASQQVDDAICVDMTEPLLLGSDWVGPPSGVAVSREASLAVGGCDERLRFAEDWDLFVQLSLLGPMALISGTTFERREQPDSLWRRGIEEGRHLETARRTVEKLLASLDRSPRPDALKLRKAAEARLAIESTIAALARGARLGIDPERVRRLQERALGRLPAAAPPFTVVLLTTWNRPRLLRQSLAQIEAEAHSIGARLVICDDHSSDPESLELLESASDRGIPVIRRDEPRDPDAALDFVVHADRKEAFRRLATSGAGVAAINDGAHEGDGLMLRKRLFELWDRCLWAAHTSAQLNNLFGFRHVLSAYPQAARILKIDDDVALHHGAFRRILETWSSAEAEGHDVLTVSAIRTVKERIVAEYHGYCVTAGICNVAVMYRREDWERFLEVIPKQIVLDKGFDLAFAHEYAPCYRPGAVAVATAPSVVYHTGRNGLHVRGADLNYRFAGSTRGIEVQ